MDEVTALLTNARFPRSSRYEPRWVLEHQMGPNALWLMEWLCEALPLRSGMRVLDLGCGKALTSIFLAKELGVSVWAGDLWIAPDGNWRRVCEAGQQDRVFPMRLEAHALPFPAGFFDAVVSVDAYTYFGTDELYLSYLSNFVRPDGLIGVAMPGLVQPIDGAVPRHLAEPQSNGKAFWEDDCWCLRTADWWEALWGRSRKVAKVSAELLPDGWQHWRDFERALEITGQSVFPSDAEAIEADAGRYLGFVRITAQRTAVTSYNLYDPGLGARVGVDG